jgi:hypothetical protein
MTLPDERMRSLRGAEALLVDLARGKVKLAEAKARARLILRHFPTDFHIRELARKAPDVLAEPPRATLSLGPEGMRLEVDVPETSADVRKCRRSATGRPQ